MKRSECINELAAALAKAQSQIEGAKRTSDNPFFKSKYADLAEVWDACRKPLTTNGLSIIQGDGDVSEGEISVETLIAHSSGQWMSSTFKAKPVKADPQGIGSCITYLRRYGLQALVGIAPEDDDGNAASQPQTNGQANGKWSKPAETAEKPETSRDKNETKMEVPKPTEEEMSVITAVYDKLIDTASEQGLKVDVDKLARLMYASKNAYPKDKSKAGIIVAWILQAKKLPAICEKVSNAF